MNSCVCHDSLLFPLIENVSAEANSKGGRAREALIEQVSKPVRWVESIENLIAQGVETFAEVGAGKVLTGLVKQINRDVRTLNIEVAESLRQTQTALENF